MNQKLDISPYLLSSPRSLRQACIDVAACGGGSRELCRRCELVELCAPADQEPSAASPGHVLRRVGKPRIVGGTEHDPRTRDTALAALARLRRF